MLSSHHAGRRACCYWILFRRSLAFLFSKSCPSFPLFMQAKLDDAAPVPAPKKKAKAAAAAASAEQQATARAGKVRAGKKAYCGSITLQSDLDSRCRAPTLI